MSLRYFSDRLEDENKELGGVRLDEANVVVELLAYLGMLERFLIGHLVGHAARLARRCLQLVHPVAVELGRVEAQAQLVALEHVRHRLVQQIAQHVFTAVFAVVLNTKRLQTFVTKQKKKQKKLEMFAVPIERHDAFDDEGRVSDHVGGFLHFGSNPITNESN